MANASESARRVEGWRRSGRSAETYAAETGVNPSTLTYWKPHPHLGTSLSLRLRDPGAAFVQEERRIAGVGTEVVAPCRVAAQCQARGLVQGDVAGLAELAVAHRQNAVGEVDVFPVEVQVRMPVTASSASSVA